MGSYSDSGVRASAGTPTHIAHPAIQAAHPLSLYDAKGVALTIGLAAHVLGLNRLYPWRMHFVLLNTCFLSHCWTSYQAPYDHRTNCKFTSQHDYP